jgi:hypothetical protein
MLVALDLDLMHCSLPGVELALGQCFAGSRRVYDVYQYIFSGEGEYVLDMHHIFSQQSTRLFLAIVKLC